MSVSAKKALANKNREKQRLARQNKDRVLAQKTLQNDFPTTFDGYHKDTTPQQRLLGSVEPICTAKQITQKLAEDLFRHFGKEFALGEWILIQHTDSGVQSHGPFPSMKEAFQHGQDNLNVGSWLAPPQRVF